MIPTNHFGGSCGPQSGSLTVSARARPLVRAFVHYTHVIDLPLGIILQPLPASKDGLQRGSHSMDMHKTCPNCDNLFYRLNHRTRYLMPDLRYAQPYPIICYQYYEDNSAQAPKVFKYLRLSTVMFWSRVDIIEAIIQAFLVVRFFSLGL